MPWARVDVPSIQCGLLKAGLARHGHDVEVRYLNMELAVRLGASRYGAIMSLRGERCNLLGEWLFGGAAFGTGDDQGEYLSRLSDPSGLGASDGTAPSAEELLDLRTRVLPEWIRLVAENGRWESFDVVGFTSTFEQNVASLALARAIKEAHKRVIVVFGGANFDGEMGAEYMRVWPWIDYVVSGEGDIVFPQLLAQIAESDPAPLPGILSRAVVGQKTASQKAVGHGAVGHGAVGHGAVGHGVVGQEAAPMVRDMDALPVPDYSEYLAALKRHGHESVLGPATPMLLYESARGCWWGEKHHCTFCGLNRLTMAFRSKSPGRVVDELAELADGSGLRAFFVVDNIMDMRYLGSVCEELRKRRWDLNLFYEVKANLSGDQLRALKGAGVASVQPGIESLSTHVLELMRKGSTMLTNVRFLKWAAYYGIHSVWNILMGFPGEADEDYLRQAELIPSLYHLQPPEGCGTIWLERYSPYFTDADFPISDIRPIDAYRHIYPIEGIDHTRIAYFFDYTASGVAGQPARDAVCAAVDEWKQRWTQDRPRLDYARGPTWIEITDTRAKPRRIRISGWRAASYEYCGQTARNAARLSEFLATELDERPGEAAITRFLASCTGARLMATENGRYLSLAIPANRGW
jgi:ribosomal peptide maturation radical SAM protein 1